MTGSTLAVPNDFDTANWTLYRRRCPLPTRSENHDVWIHRKLGIRIWSPDQKFITGSCERTIQLQRLLKNFKEKPSEATSVKDIGRKRKSLSVKPHTHFVLENLSFLHNAKTMRTCHRNSSNGHRFFQNHLNQEVRELVSITHHWRPRKYKHCEQQPCLLRLVVTSNSLLAIIHTRTHNCLWLRRY